MFGLSLVSVVIGFVAGGVVVTVVPKVASWFTKQVDSAESKVSTAANTVSAVANTVSKSV